MTRFNARSARPQAARVPAHGMLLEADLQGWAGERIAHGGRTDALLGRVEALLLSLDGRSLEARVRGNRPLPYRVRIDVDEAGPVSRCTCSSTAAGPCRHAVAALEALRFPSPVRKQATSGDGRGRPSGRATRGRGRIVRHATAAPGFVILGGAERTMGRDERLAAARLEELSHCRQRSARARVVRREASDDDAERYEVAARGPLAAGVVTRRGTDVDLWSCECDGFVSNELQTCAHVERVRVWNARNKKRQAIDDRPRLSVWARPRAWVDRVPSPLQEIRVDLPLERPLGTLTRFFDEQGWLRPPPEGRPAPRWASDAVGTARRVAGRRGWRCEVDARATGRIERAADDDELAAIRALAAEDDGAWSRIRARLGFTLHPYQEQGARFLARRGRVFLADDMGLGKTVQAIVAALLLRGAGVRRTLVVCPASLKHQWSREIDKSCGEQALVVEGPRPQRLQMYAGWQDGFLIVNYELVLRDLEAIREVGADLIVLDEAQRIKNWNTKTARAVKQLHSPNAFILTGTPLENRLMELHSLVEFLHPRALGPRWRLLPFHTVTDATGRVVAYEGLDVLRRRLGGFFIRRERKKVLDQLPDRTDNTFWTGMSPAQRAPYRRHAATVATLLSRNQPLAPAEVRSMLRALTAMRMLCNAHAQYAWERYAPRLADPEPASRAELRALSSPKLEEFGRVLEDLLDESGEKVVVFSEWARMLRLAHFAVRERLESRDLRAEVFHGSLTGRERTAMLDSFGRDPEFRVLFSTDAGGLGLNLQEAASIVVNLEVPWNPAVLEQRIGRVHRIGQRRSVQVLHFVTRGAIEERVRQVLESKRALFDGLLAGDADRIDLGAAGRSSFLEKVRGLVEEPVGR